MDYFNLPKAGTNVWHDYDGDEIYADVAIEIDEWGAMTSTEQAAHEAGIGSYDYAAETAGYRHGDQIGSTRTITGPGSAGVPPATVQGRIVYTAFGERVWSDGTIGTRYQYAGAWGYQSDLYEDASGNLPFVHVGHRWYDPSTGRYLQRDPIGIEGGLNVYAYVDNSPLLRIDPYGDSWWPNTGLLRYGPSKKKTGYRKWSKPLTFRCGPNIHVYGLRGAALAGVAGAGAAGAGYGAGKALDKGVAICNNGFGLSDGFGDIIYRNFYDDGSPYDPWGIGSTPVGGGGNSGPIWGPPTGGCFIKGTLVETDVGLVPIESITPGDCVTTMKVMDSMDSLEQVVRVFTSTSNEVVELFLEDDFIVSTVDHPFFVVGQGWTRACELTNGSLLLAGDGIHKRIESARMRVLPRATTVYNLHVDGSRMFLVGQSRVLVHNKM